MFHESITAIYCQNFQFTQETGSIPFFVADQFATLDSDDLDEASNRQRDLALQTYDFGRAQKTIIKFHNSSFIMHHQFKYNQVQAGTQLCTK